MLRGFWLATNGSFFEVATHEVAIHDACAQKVLGLSSNQISFIDGIQGNPDKIRLAAVKMGLLRLRDYSDSLHVEYWASQKQSNAYLRVLQRMILRDKCRKGKESGLSQAWMLSAENLNPRAHRRIKMPMKEFLSRSISPIC